MLDAGICYGALDVAADAALTRQAAHTLAKVLPQGTRVQVSPLRRCQQLATALQRVRPDLAWDTEPRLREMDFGDWEGLPWADIPRAAIDAWTADFATHRFGGKESANEVLARVAAAWDELPPTGDVLWITHSGVAQAAAVLRTGVRQVMRASEWPLANLAYGEWTTFTVTSPLRHSAT
jgi:alpha-ribazole phosphatase